MAFLSHFLLVSVLMHVAISGRGDVCDNRLIWKRIYGENQNIAIEVCCDVTLFSAARLLEKWTLVEPFDIENKMVNTTAGDGSRMELSVCDDGTVDQGQLISRTDCRLKFGYVLRLDGGMIQRFDDWYITCFDTPCGRGGRNCTLDRLCTSTSQWCDKVFITRDIVNGTDTNMTILIRVGEHILQKTELLVEVRELNENIIYDNERPSDQKPDYGARHYANSTATAPAGANLIYEVTNLNPRKRYVVKTCAKIRPPAEFFRRYPNWPIPAEKLYCLDDAPYYPSRHKNKGTYYSPVTFMKLIFVVFLGRIICARLIG